MRNGRIAKHYGNVCNAQSFVIEQVACVLHSLTLVEIKNGRSKDFFKSFLQITLVDGNLSAELPDGDRFANMFDKYIASLLNFFTVCFISQELTVYHIQFF